MRAATIPFAQAIYVWLLTDEDIQSLNDFFFSNGGLSQLLCREFWREVILKRLLRLRKTESGYGESQLKIAQGTTDSD